jgi:hypothetical protein
MIPPPGPVSPTLYTTSAPVTVGVDEASLPEDDDPPPQETRTSANPIKQHLMDRIGCPFVSTKQDAIAIWDRYIWAKYY